MAVNVITAQIQKPKEVSAGVQVGNPVNADFDRELSLPSNKVITAQIQKPKEVSVGVQAGNPVNADFGRKLSLTSNKNYNNLVNKPQINGVTLQGNVPIDLLGLRNIYYDTTANWNMQPGLRSQEGAMYIYSDYSQIVDGENVTFVPGIRIGDGTSYLIDLPFLADAASKALMEHITNDGIHVTAEDRLFWNNKVTSFVDVNDNENLVLSKTALGI